MSGAHLTSLPQAEVRPTGSPLAIFDLDRTLIPGSSLVVLARQLGAAGLVDRWAVAGAIARNLAFRQRGASASTAERVCSDALGAAAGMPARELALAVERSARIIAGNVRPNIQRLVEHHLRRGDHLLLVSASPHQLVDAIARRTGFHAGIGTRVEVLDGVVTGRLDGPFCHAEGKLARLRHEYGNLDLRNATAYSDAATDLPLLAACGASVAVHPDRSLRAVALRSGWPILAC